MSASESDIVLSAVRRGEETLPKLKAATGLDYAALQRILYSLEMTTVRKEESAAGFARYFPYEKTKAPADHLYAPVSVHPSYNRRTEAAANADEAAIEQRNAPYCITCRAVCLLHGADRNGRRRWKCRPCNQTFLGSGDAKRFYERKAKVAHIDEHEEGEQRVREIVEAGGGTLPTCVDCGAKRSVGSGERCRPCYLAKAEAKKTAAEPAEPGPCWCGRTLEPGYKTHRGKHKGVATAQNGGGAVAVETSPLGDAVGAKAKFRRAVDALVFGDEEKEAPRVEVDFEQEKATVASPVGEKEPPMEIPKASIVSIDGFMQFNIEVRISVAEMSTWPSYKISDFWDGVRKVLAATNPDKPLR